MTVIAWRGAGASVLSLTWQRDRGGSVQGFPYGYYGPCALDERYKLRPVGFLRKKDRIVCCGEAERTGTEIAGRRSSDRSFVKFGSVSTTAVFPTSTKRGPFFDNGQTDEHPGVAMEKLT